MASLPDLIFTVLFFFMIVTHMRTSDVKVRYKVPQGTELTKLTHKSTTQYIYIGTDARDKSNTGVVQMNDRIVDAAGITDMMADIRQRMMPEDQQNLSVDLRADRSTKMSVIKEVKEALRKAGALTVNYSATDKK